MRTCDRYEVTGMSMGALLRPMAFIETGIFDLLIVDTPFARIENIARVRVTVK
jgi:hypothetical protein